MMNCLWHQTHLASTLAQYSEMTASPWIHPESRQCLVYSSSSQCLAHVVLLSARQQQLDPKGLITLALGFFKTIMSASLQGYIFCF